jgi:hypothetical protein
MKNKYVKVSIVQSGSVVKVNSNTTAAQTVLNTTCIFDEHWLTTICHSSKDWPASIHEQQCRCIIS